MQTRVKFSTMVASLALAFGAATANAEISGGVVKIGVMNDMSGLYADIGGPGSVVAAKLAVEDFQKQFNPKFKIEIVSADHQNKPDVGSNVARQWYDTDGVDAIADVPTSSVALAVSQVTRDKNKAFLATGPGSSDLTGKACSPNTVHFLYDTWMLAHGTGTAVTKNGGDTWFFLTADYAFGHALERDTAEAVIGLANAGGDTINSIKQAAEFGIVKGGQSLAGLLVFITDVHGLGLEKAQGLLLTETFYWDHDDKTREWSKRFAAANKGIYPSSDHAGVYAVVLDYLKAVKEIDSDDGAKAVAQMKSRPAEDPLFGKSTTRIDGRTLHPAYLFEVKKPSESKGPYDYYKLRATIPANEAFRPLNEGGCPLVKS
ncbi:MAG: ABC transporter permease [Burkholderiales bacterium]|nr:MAG: ABC transporter permease [Burkholderiales bacterium]